MSERTTDVADMEAPPADAFEQSLPAAPAAAPDPADHDDDVALPELPVAGLSDDFEAPEPDVIEQHQAVSPYEDDDWR